MDGGCDGGPLFSVAVLLPQLLTCETVAANETNFLNYKCFSKSRLRFVAVSFIVVFHCSLHLLPVMSPYQLHPLDHLSSFLIRRSPLKLPTDLRQYNPLLNTHLSHTYTLAPRALPTILIPRPTKPFSPIPANPNLPISPSSLFFLTKHLL